MRKSTMPGRLNISKRLVVFVSLCMIFLSIVNIGLSAELSHYGNRLAELTELEQALLEQSESYSREMIEVDALTQLAVVAREQGYSSIASALSLSQLSTIAFSGNR